MALTKASVPIIGQTEVAKAESMFATLTDFNTAGGPAAYGTGPVWIAGQHYWCDGVNLYSVSKIVNNPEIALSRYRAIPNSTLRKIAWVGDSTTQMLFLSSVGGYSTIIGVSSSTDYCYTTFVYPDGPFNNVTHINCGENGQTLNNFVNNLAANTAASIASQSPDLIVFSYGINDVRLGLTNLIDLTDLLKRAVASLQAALPNTDIILRIPNNLLYDSTNGNGYIDAPVSLAKLQSYTEILRNAYRKIIGVFSNVYVLDTQGGSTQVFTSTSRPLANPGSHNIDPLHPTGEGFAAVIREVVLAIGNYGDNHYANIYDEYKYVPLPKYSPSVVDSIFGQTGITNANAHLYYPRVCEDPSKYNLIVFGANVQYGQGSYFDVNISNKQLGALLAGDIFVQYGIKDTTSGSKGEAIDNAVAAWSDSGVNGISFSGMIRFLSLPAGYPKNQSAGKRVSIFRLRPATQKYDADPDIAISLSANAFTSTSITQVAQRAGTIGNISATAGTAPTTGGTITIAVNGTTVETLTFANNATSATGAGSFSGIWLDEGDVVTATINAGFAGGAKLRIKVSNR